MIDINKIYNSIKEDLKALFQLVLEDNRVGTNVKVGINTLASSRLHDEVDVENKGNIFSIFYNDYLDYIESGRKPHARKVPIDALIDWCRRKGIPSDNKTVYAIRESIYEAGIPSRPFFPIFDKEIDNLWESEWADNIFNEILNELNKFFNE